MKTLLRTLALFLGFAPAAFAADAAHEGLARPWQLGFSEPATPVMEQLNTMHNYLLVTITIITLFVLALMIYIAVRFRRSRNPVASTVTHNTLLEIAWTGIPILILIAIAIPSLKLHYYMQRVVEPELTLKVVGYQWYWRYEYPDQGGFGFDSYLKKENLQPDEPRLLTVDNRLVVPVDTKVRVLVTGADVIHAFAMPVFGVKRDGVPGRLNETWFEAKKTGTFYGQCSELCGVGHGFMPIVVDVVSKQEFASWVATKQKENNIDPATLNKPAEAGQNPAGAPIAKPESAMVANPSARIDEQKKRSAEKGAGKPAHSTENPIPPVDNSKSGLRGDDHKKRTQPGVPLPGAVPADKGRHEGQPGDASDQMPSDEPQQ